MKEQFKINIKSFKINKLHGTLTFDLKFKDNILILLGENGSCKTTIIKMLFYTLSLQLNELEKYNFESLEITINNKTLKLHKSAISVNPYNNPIRDIQDEIHYVLRKLPFPVKHEIERQILNYGDIAVVDIERICERYDIPFSYMEDVYVRLQSLTRYWRRNNGVERIKSSDETKTKLLIHELETFKVVINEKIKKETHILYLPTYRRIEQELFDEDARRSRSIRSEREDNYTILKEFGMKDVDDDIKNTLSDLRESSRTKLNELTLGYLGDIVNKQYSINDFHEITSITPDKIDDIMKRVNENILPQDKKDTLKKTLLTIKDKGENLTDYEKILCYYFLKLEKYNNELIEQEQNINDFVEVCKTYLVNKDIEYDGQNFEFTIKLKNNDGCKDEEQEETKDVFSQEIIRANKGKISLQNLSSGEKQVVSLFSHLYLSKKQNYIVLIDEPELSLSVEWQRKFLSDVKKGKFCKGLVAVTHSPFIFENELDSYAHAMEEFKA